MDGGLHTCELPYGLAVLTIFREEEISYGSSGEGDEYRKLLRSGGTIRNTLEEEGGGGRKGGGGVSFNSDSYLLDLSPSL